ncbi:MAG: glycoside hydrolase, partial [Ignavibacteria bacterium]|nr:glycoside hydrolase [Ignavibacteria bacterium]
MTFSLRFYFLTAAFSLTLFWTICFCQTQKIEISDSGWRLWCDTSAQWKNDDLYLPHEVDLSKLPVNPPSGGWEILDSKLGVSVQLPSTVEQHFWGKFGYRNYKGEYWFEDEDNQVKNGNYLGVSWWWKEIFIPKSFENKIILLHIRGARLRAEVYLNRILVGYNIITETSFECDISKAIIPGKKNLLAIRITNPGGRLDWVDTKLMEWGKYKFHMSHGFGGLDRGITITAHEPVYLSDMWIANTPQIKRIVVHSSIRNTLNRNVECKIAYQILDKVNKSKVLKSIVEFKSISANNTLKIETKIDLENAKLWSVENPNLYLLKALVITEYENEKSIDEKEKTFGFRWFEADGVGSNAVLRLNGERIRLYSAISWGFWGLNGLFPTKELAEKEVKAAKSFGMNCIQFHRNVGKTEVLDAQDRLGLLRYMEPGGGQTALGEKFSMYADSPKERIDVSGENGEAETFAEKYMEEKILRMIRDHRSHPSLIMYCVQNEINPDLRNPRIFNLIRKMHNEDPSRIVILKSGIPPVNQVWMKPYDNTVYYDKGDGYSGWWDEHTVGGPGVWRDLLYKNPNDFTHRSTNEKEIVTWGEMLGAAVPDNHDLMIRQINSKGGKSYDLEDHREILNAYNLFLDKWNFKSAFKSSENLFKNIGNKCYDFWGRVIETARLAEANDFFVISGWESTAIENHSGLVDNLRNFKGDPTLLRKGLEKLKPVIKSRSLVIEAGQKAILDLFVLNETNLPHPKKLILTLISPTGIKKKLAELIAPSFERDKFVYRLADSLTTPQLELSLIHI